jgi:hypothetical protein
MPHEAICFTCLHAIGSEDAASLYCTLRGKACMRRCASSEREVGADLPERVMHIGGNGNSHGILPI